MAAMLSRDGKDGEIVMNDVEADRKLGQDGSALAQQLDQESEHYKIMNKRNIRKVCRKAAVHVG